MKVRNGSEADQAARLWMSASPPITDIDDRRINVRKVPKADIAALFDHFVGGAFKRHWYRKA